MQVEIRERLMCESGRGTVLYGKVGEVRCMVVMISMNLLE